MAALDARQHVEDVLGFANKDQPQAEGGGDPELDMSSTPALSTADWLGEGDTRRRRADVFEVTGGGLGRIHACEVTVEGVRVQPSACYLVPEAAHFSGEAP